MKVLYRTMVFFVLSRISEWRFCAAYNFFSFLNGSKKRIKFIGGMYEISDASTRLNFTRPSRYRYYSDGVERRLSHLFSQYVGDEFAISLGDVVVECGANIGEFTRHCQKLGAVVYAFEPDPTEYSALALNLEEGGVPYPLALWYEDTVVNFVLQNETGDSSVSLGASSGKTISIVAKRIDSIPEIAMLEKIRLFKLEAEGFEYEVLRGATGILGRVEYIAADLGPERGEDNVASLPEVVNFLLGKGFLVERFFPGRSIVLFRNNSMSDEAKSSSNDVALKISN